MTIATLNWRLKWQRNIIASDLLTKLIFDTVLVICLHFPDCYLFHSILCFLKESLQLRWYPLGYGVSGWYVRSFSSVFVSLYLIKASDVNRGLKIIKIDLVVLFSRMFFTTVFHLCILFRLVNRNLLVRFQPNVSLSYQQGLIKVHKIDFWKILKINILLGHNTPKNRF